MQNKANKLMQKMVKRQQKKAFNKMHFNKTLKVHNSNQKIEDIDEALEKNLGHKMLNDGTDEFEEQTPESE